MPDEILKERAEHREPNYMLVFGTLAVLTALEIAVAYVGLPRIVTVATLVIMAFVKVALVALYFMHLQFEKLLLRIIVVVPIIVALILLIGVTPDALHTILRPRL